MKTKTQCDNCGTEHDAGAPCPHCNKAGYPATYYQRLFDHMSEEHNLTLLDSEMDEIVRIAQVLALESDSPPTKPMGSPVQIKVEAQSVVITEPDRQAIILALADLANRRPGWLKYLGNIADSFRGRGMFDELYKMRQGKVLPDIQEFRGKKAMVMYFETDKHMDEVIAAFKELYPGAVGRKLQ